MAAKPDPRIRLVESIGKLEVWLVNDRVVRDNYDSDFDQGANDLARPDWMPAWEIWIAARYEDELPEIELHELHERDDMYEFHYSYEHAHDIAKKLEGKGRANRTKLPQMLEKERIRCLKLQEEKLGKDAKDEAEEETEYEDEKMDPEREERFTTDMSLIEIINPGAGSKEEDVAPQGISSVVHVYPGEEGD